MLAYTVLCLKNVGENTRREKNKTRFVCLKTFPCGKRNGIDWRRKRRRVKAVMMATLIARKNTNMTGDGGDDVAGMTLPPLPR